MTCPVREWKCMTTCMTANRSAGVRARDGVIRVITAGNAEPSLCTFPPPPVAMRERCYVGRDPADSVPQVSSSATTPPLSVTTLPPTLPSGLRLPLIRAPRPHVFHSINDFAPTADKPFVLGLPTGSSPIPTYKALIKLVKEGKLSSVVRLISLRCP
jgi:hypothetical protein